MNPNTQAHGANAAAPVRIEALPALDDNYIWLLHSGRRAAVVDPGDSEVVLNALKSRGLDLELILITHHHADHIDGVPALRQATGARVVGPATERFSWVDQGVSAGDRIDCLGNTCTVLELPGHTIDHRGYLLPDPAGDALFCGDTLFAAGCGRLFEGTPAQMAASLGQISALRPGTRICCTHEYTVSNLRFARAVEPGNAALEARAQWAADQRAAGKPTLPSVLADELATNPFLRCQAPAVVQAVKQHAPETADDPVAVFAALRRWKDQFR